jgi:hypothetical protein
LGPGTGLDFSEEINVLLHAVSTEPRSIELECESRLQLSVFVKNLSASFQSVCTTATKFDVRLEAERNMFLIYVELYREMLYIIVLDLSDIISLCSTIYLRKIQTA